MKQVKLLIILCVSLALLLGCVPHRSPETLAKKVAFDELNLFHEKPSSELKCENLDSRYDRCNEYRYFEHIDHCRGRYTSVIARCYGVVK